MDVFSSIASGLTTIDACIKAVSYYRQVKYARDDIDRLNTRLLETKYLFEHIDRLVDEPSRNQLPTTRSFLESLAYCTQNIESLALILGINKLDRTSRYRWIPALKWPFISRNIESELTCLELHRQTCCDALQIDAMYSIC